MLALPGALTCFAAKIQLKAAAAFFSSGLPGDRLIHTLGTVFGTT
jgi:hypothetical protein